MHVSTGRGKSGDTADVRWPGSKPARCLFITRIADVSVLADRLGRFCVPRLQPAADYPLSERSTCGAAPSVLDSERTELRAWLSARDGQLALSSRSNPATSTPVSGPEAARRVEGVGPRRTGRPLLHKLHAAMPDAHIPCGAPADRCSSSSSTPRCRRSRSPLPLRRLMAPGESTSSMISIDAGPAHVAAALGLPLVVMPVGRVSGCHAVRQVLRSLCRRLPGSARVDALRWMRSSMRGVPSPWRNSNGLFALARAPSTTSATANCPPLSMAGRKMLPQASPASDRT